MDKLTAIKIKMPNGSYSDQILISALAENVRYDGTRSVKDILDLLDARISSIIALEAGSTTGDAELMDLRIGANGKSNYASAGQAVRSNINKLQELILIQETQPSATSSDNTTSWNKLWINNGAVEEIEIPTKDEFDILLNTLTPVNVLTWQSGDFDVNGANHTNRKSIRSTNFIPNNIIGIMCSPSYKFCVWAWDKETGGHVGHLKEDGTFGQTSSYKYVTSFALDKTLGYKYKVTFYNENSTTNIEAGAGVNCITYRDTTDTTFSLDGVAADAAAVGNVIAPVYNPSSAYNVGDYVNYNGTIYRCKTAIGNNGEEWAIGHWEATNISNEFKNIDQDITDLKSAVNDITKTEQVPEELTFIDGEYINSSGAFVEYPGWSRTDYIEVDPGSTIEIYAASSSGYNFSYDESKQPIGSRWSVSFGTQAKTIGASVKYIVLSNKTNDLKYTNVFVGATERSLKSVLPLTEKMTEEVNEIVENSTPNKIDHFVNPTAYLMKQQIPSYYFDQNEIAQNKHNIGYLDDKINSVPNGYHFIFVTDTHWIRNAKQSTKLISYVRDRIGAKFVLFGGDILTAHNTDAIAYRCLCEFMFDYKNAFGSNFLPVVGNHDLNSMGPDNASHLEYSDLVPVFMQGCDSRFHYCDYYDVRIEELGVSQGMTADEVEKLKQYFRTCYWVDDIDGKTRYIIYNTGIGSLDGGSGIQRFISADIIGSYEELLILEWVYETLMSVPDGYNVIFCSHIPASVSMVGPGGTTPITSVRKTFATLIPSFKAKIIATVYIHDSISNIERWCPRSMSFDFRNAPNIGTVAVMGGHYHIDTFLNFGFSSSKNQNHTSGYQSNINEQSWSTLQNSGATTEGHFKYEIPIIITQYDAYSGQSTSGVPQHSMTLGTITEQCFDVVTIRPNGDISLTRFGAGNDRYITIT